MTSFARTAKVPSESALSMEEIQRRLMPVFQKYRIHRAYLFGSYARGEATPESDVDIRVEPGKNDALRSLFQASGMRLDMQDALGRDVDFLTCLPSKTYDRAFYDNLLREEVLIYEAPVEGSANPPAYSEVRVSS